jgi:hypothetical protein
MRQWIYRHLPDGIRAAMGHVFYPLRFLKNRSELRILWRASRQTKRFSFFPAVRTYALSTREYLNKKQTKTSNVQSPQAQPNYRAIPDETRFNPSPPRTLGYNPMVHLAVPFNPPLYVASVQDVRVYGDAGDVITNDNTLLSEVSFRIPVQMWQERWEHPVLKCDPLPAPHPLHGTYALLTSRWAGVNYFHWMFNLLPRVASLERAGIATDGLGFLTNTLRFNVQWEMLQALGIHREQIVQMSNTAAFHIESLWVMPLLITTGHRRRWVCDWLRKHFLVSNTMTKPTRRLYLSRADVTSRRLENEEEVMDLLGPLGFEKVVVGSSSIFDQSALFAQAEVVLAPHTTGFANLVFCPPKTRVLDFMPFDRLKTYMWELSACMDLDYYYAPADWSMSPKRAGAYDHDTIIRPAQLRALLNAAGIR